MPGKIINLMSDTVTHPTQEMRKAMYEAEVGDDVQKADPTVNKLQKLAAEMMGMEDALFVPSGTMGNLIAMLCHCPAGREVLLETDSHINKYEVGGIARVAGLMPHPIKGKLGILDPADVRAAIRKENVHFPALGLLCIENTHNVGGGTVYPLEYLAEYRKIADEHGIKVHMDGARVFNAAVRQQVDVKEIVKHADSVMFCLAKGLSAPVGSMLCGKGEFIAEAVRARKMLGGGMRQAGVLAAAGIVSLEQSIDRLADDHQTARQLAEGLSSINGISVDIEGVQTNLVYFKISGGKDAFAVRGELKEKYGILCEARNAEVIRMVTHRHIGSGDVGRVLECVGKVMR
ncbi:MAG: beta-eliminating lyase-related protein [Oscillospiraceae bacterium]|nr:beta-eliminating lyase-related protein [Oscillospiraceae bacterium]